MEIIKIIKTRPIFGDTLRDCLVRSLVNSHSFKTANKLADLLNDMDNFTENQINEIIRGALNNNQIHGGHIAEPFVKDIIAKYESKIKSEFKDLVKRVYISDIIEINH